MENSVQVKVTQLDITPDQFASLIANAQSQGKNSIAVGKFACEIEHVKQNPLTIIGRSLTGSGTMTMEVVGHTVCVTEINVGYPAD